PGHCGRARPRSGPTASGIGTAVLEFPPRRRPPAPKRDTATGTIARVAAARSEARRGSIARSGPEWQPMGEKQAKEVKWVGSPGRPSLLPSRPLCVRDRVKQHVDYFRTTSYS